MAHGRTQIRSAFADELSGLTTTQTRVYQSRVYPLDDAELPGLCVFTGDEEIETSEIEMQERSLNVVVEGYHKVGSSLEDTLDKIAAEVETAILADEFLDGLTQGIDLEGIEIEIKAEGEQTVGVIRMDFRVLYRTEKGTPETTL